MEVRYYRKPFDHWVIDNFIEPNLAFKLSDQFLDYDSDLWYVYENPLEKKKTCNSWTVRLTNYPISTSWSSAICLRKSAWPTICSMTSSSISNPTHNTSWNRKAGRRITTSICISWIALTIGSFTLKAWNTCQPLERSTSATTQSQSQGTSSINCYNSKT